MQLGEVVEGVLHIQLLVAVSLGYAVGYLEGIGLAIGRIGIIVEGVGVH